MKIYSPMIKFFFILVCMLFASKNAQALIVPLTVTESAGLNRQKEPVTYGVPFSRNENLTSVDGLKITTDKDGINKIAAQFRVLSRYNDVPNGNGPIRVVLVDFQNDLIHANATDTFYLHTTGGGLPTSTDMGIMTNDGVTVETGALTAFISKSTGWFSSIKIDADGDGQIDDNVLGDSSSDGWLIRSVSGDDFSSWNDTNDVSIEENGALRCVVKVSGFFKNGLGEKLIPDKGDEGLSYTIRFVFFKNKGYVKVYPRLENENLGWTTNGTTNPAHYVHIDYSFIKTTTTVNESNETVDFGGATYNGLGKYTLHMDEVSNGSTQSYTWEQKVNGGPAFNKQYDSYADTRDSNVGLMVGQRWFWQNHPKQYRFDDGGDVSYIDLWPDENANPRGVLQMDSSGNHRILGGMWKTHELIYYFHRGTDNDFHEVMSTLQNRLIALCDDEYYAFTNFFYSIPPATWQSKNYNFGDVTLNAVLDNDHKRRRAFIDSSYIEKIGDISIQEARAGRKVPGPGAPAYWSWYGIVEFGDFPRGKGTWGYSGVHYGWDYSSLVSFLRFQDYNYLNFAEEIVTHRADIGIMHDGPAFNSSSSEAEYHGAHRYEQDALFSFYNTHSAALKTGPRDGSHMWYRGIALQYLMTGEMRFLDSLNDIAEGRKFVYWSKWNCNDSAICDLTSIRSQGRSIGALITHYIVTGDQDSLNKSYQLYINGLAQKERLFGKGKYFEELSSIYDATILQTSISIEYLIQLYYELLRAGNSLEADRIKSDISYQAVWFEETIFNNSFSCSDSYSNGQFGYAQHDGEYFPYMVSKLWDKDAQWICGNLLEVYMLPYIADLYAFQYETGNGEIWLTKARTIYKDWINYGLTDAWVNISYSPRPVDTINESGFSGDAWAKWGQPLKKGLFYLTIESSLHFQSVIIE